MPNPLNVPKQLNEVKSYENKFPDQQPQVTPMVIFWDLDNTSVFTEKTEIFAESIRSYFHNQNFHIKLFYAAGNGETSRAKDILRRMINADIKYELVPSGRNKADLQIKNKFEKFNREDCEKPWITLISTDGFFETVKKNTEKFVLVYDHTKNVSENSDLDKMIRNASYRIKKEYFKPK